MVSLPVLLNKHAQRTHVGQDPVVDLDVEENTELLDSSADCPLQNVVIEEVSGKLVDTDAGAMGGTVHEKTDQREASLGSIGTDSSENNPATATSMDVDKQIEVVCAKGKIIMVLTSF